MGFERVIAIMKSLILAVFLAYGVLGRSIDQYSATLGEENDGDCTCLMRSERVEGNKIIGKYSYVDPVGSLIEVVYEMNQDKTNYVEGRKVIKNYVNSGTGSVLKQNTGLTAQQVVERVIKDITPTVITVVRSTVQNSNTDLGSESARRQLVQNIIVKLRPVVFQVVTEVLRETGTTSLDAGELTDLIVLRLTPVIEQGVNQEAQAIIASSLAQKAKLEDEIVLEITTNLRPTIIRIIQASVQSSDLSDIDSLFQAILKRLRLVVLNEVQTALANSPLSLDIDANQLTDRIMVELTPFVRQALEQEVNKVQSQIEGQVFNEVKQTLQPAVTTVIKDTISQAQVNLDDPKGIVEQVIRQLRPVVFKAVSVASKSSPYKLDAEKLTVRIIIEITPSIESGVQAEVESVKASQSQVNDGLIQLLIDDLKPAILGINANDDTISQNLADEIVAWAPGRLGGLVGQRVTALLASESRNLPDSVIADRVIAGMQGDIIDAIRNNAKYRVVINKKGFNVLMQRIGQALRPLILRQIQVYKQSQVPVVKPRPQPPQTTGGGLTSIFGVSGKNTVKFDSPQNNYGYEFDKKISWISIK